LCNTNKETNEKLIAVSLSLNSSTYSLPVYQTESGVCDILDHLKTRYFSLIKGNILSDGLLESAMRSIIYF